MKQSVTINLGGCDDSTEFEVDLTDEQTKFLRMISALTRRNSEYGCMPVMSVNA